MGKLGQAAGAKRICDGLGISSPSQLRAMRDPSHPTYDARVAAVVCKRPNGRLVADAAALAELKRQRAQETSEARRRVRQTAWAIKELTDDAHWAKVTSRKTRRRSPSNS